MRVGIGSTVRITGPNKHGSWEFVGMVGTVKDRTRSKLHIVFSEPSFLGNWVADFARDHLERA